VSRQPSQPDQSDRTERPLPPAPFSPRRKRARWTELFLLFILLPALLAASVQRGVALHDAMRAIGLGWMVTWGAMPGLMIFPVLLGTTLLIIAVLLVDRSFDRSNLWSWRRCREDLPRILIWWSVVAVLILPVTAFMAFRTDLLPESGFMRLPRENPLVLIFIWIFYPLISAYPQEITHRVFFWHRYAGLFTRRSTLILVNALVFAWMHALFWNWIALAMTFVGGLLFAYTYDRTRSGLAAGIEHALYGAWCFTIGLGWFVFAGR
jgi:membrane protease YdiL (CAAX protease family)